MYSIHQSRRVRGSAGDPIPKVFDAFEEKKIIFRRGQLCLIAAGPGTGKSALVLTLALRSGLPTLYMSPDSDAFTQVSRSLAVMSGLTMDEAQQWARGDGSTRTREKAKVLDSLPIRFNYLASPSLDDMERSVQAFEELYGEYPAITVIDNITNVRNGSEANDADPFGGLEGFLDYAHEMARNTQSCVFGLHHVTGPYNDADKPIPLSGVKGQVGRVPEMVLTLHKEITGNETDILKVSPVKNRGSRTDASGHWYAELEFNGETMQIRDPKIDPAMYSPVVGVQDPFGEETDDRRRQVEEMLG